MEIVSLPDEETDFRDSVVNYRNKTNVVIETNIDNIVIRVTRAYNAIFSEKYYVTIENTDFPESTWGNYKDRIIGIMSLYEKNYDNVINALEPHSYLAPEYRGKGYIESIYRWLLENGFTLVSGSKQTKFSNGLWRKLAQSHECRLYDALKHDIIYEGEKFDIDSYYIRLLLRKNEKTV